MGHGVDPFWDLPEVLGEAGFCEQLAPRRLPALRSELQPPREEAAVPRRKLVKTTRFRGRDPYPNLWFFLFGFLFEPPQTRAPLG